MAMNLIPVAKTHCDILGEALYWSDPRVWIRKINKHIAANNPERVRKYLIEMFNWNSPCDFFYKVDADEFADYDELKDAYRLGIKYLKKYYIVGFMALPGVHGLQMAVIKPFSGNCYHSTFDYRKK